MGRTIVTSVFQSVLSVAICVAAVATVPGCSKGPDISTPKVAAKSFTKAMEDGDMDTLKKCDFGSEADFAAIKTFSDVAQASKKYHKAITDKFGEQAKVAGMMDIPDFSKQVDNSDEKITGDKASLVPKEGGDPLSLKKDSDGWKVDISEFGKMAAEMNKMGKPLTDTLNDMAKDISDGKFKSVVEVQMETGKRMQTLMGAH